MDDICIVKNFRNNVDIENDLYVEINISSKKDIAHYQNIITDTLQEIIKGLHKFGK